MTLPATGNISLGMVGQELGIAMPLSLGDSRVRTLAGKTSGDISLTDLRGKTAVTYVAPTISCDTFVEAQAFAFQGQYASVSVTPNFAIVGGEGPFNVSWARVSGAGQITVSGTSPPTFSADGEASFTVFATFRATVTDNRGSQVQSPLISVTLKASDQID